MQKIVTNIWFDGQVQEALDFYTSIFPDSKVTAIAYYGDAGPGPKGEIMVANFELAGQAFTIINGGPGFPHSPAMSLLIQTLLANQALTLNPLSTCQFHTSSPNWYLGSGMTDRRWLICRSSQR